MKYGADLNSRLDSYSLREHHGEETLRRICDATSHRAFEHGCTIKLIGNTFAEFWESPLEGVDEWFARVSIKDGVIKITRRDGGVKEIRRLADASETQMTAARTAAIEETVTELSDAAAYMIKEYQAAARNKRASGRLAA